jgi:hypothetical protein
MPATAVVAGVFLGSSAWWLILSSVVGALRHKINNNALLWINRASGAVIIAFGLWSEYSATVK